MGTLKIASSAALAFAALLGCGPKDLRHADRLPGSGEQVLCGWGQELEGRVAQADERASRHMSEACRWSRGSRNHAAWRGVARIPLEHRDFRRSDNS